MTLQIRQKMGEVLRKMMRLKMTLGTKLSEIINKTLGVKPQTLHIRQKMSEKRVNYWEFCEVKG